MSSQRFIDIIHEKNEEKKKKEDEKKRKQEERERKRVARQQEKAMAQLKRRRLSKGKAKKVVESSSEEEEEEDIEYADNSDDDREIPMNVCGECEMPFRGGESTSALRCDICCRMYHRECCGVNLCGKTSEETQQMDYTCKNC